MFGEVGVTVCIADEDSQRATVNTRAVVGLLVLAHRMAKTAALTARKYRSF